MVPIATMLPVPGYMFRLPPLTYLCYCGEAMPFAMGKTPTGPAML